MEVRLDWRDGKLFFGERTICGDNEFDAARSLLKFNLASKFDRMTTYRGDTPCFKGDVGWFADHEVRASEQGTPVFRRANPSKRIA